MFEDKRTWVLKAANTTERDKWVAAIGVVIEWINSHEDPRTVTALKDKLASQNEQLVMERMKLEDESKTAIMKLAFEKELVEFLKKHKEELESKNQDLNETNTKLNTRIEELEEETSMNKKQLSDLESQIAQKMKTIEDIEELMTKLQAQIKPLQEENAQLKRTIDSLRGDINSRDNKIAELGQELEQKDHKIETLLDDIKKNQNTINELLSDKAKIMQEKQKFEALLEDERVMSAQLEDENQKLKEALQKQESINKELAGAGKNAEGEIHSLKTKLQESLWEQNKAAEDFKLAKKELDDRNNALSRSESQLIAANNEILDMKRKLAEQEAEKLTANQTIEQLRELLKEKDSNIEDRTAGEREFQQAMNKLKQDLNNSLRENERLSEEIANYKGKLEAAEEALKYTQKLSQAEHEIIQLKGEIEKLQASTENASKRADTLNHENEMLTEKVSELSKLVSHKEEENKQLLSKFSLENKTLSNKIEGLTAELEHMENSFERANSELLSLKEEIRQQKLLQKNSFSELEKFYTALIKNIFYGHQIEDNDCEQLIIGLQGCLTQIPELGFLKELYELTNYEVLSLMKKLKSLEESKMKAEEQLSLQNKDISKKNDDLGRDNKLLNSQVMKYQREVRDQKEKILNTVEEFNYIFINATKNIFTSENEVREETCPAIFRLDTISQDFKQAKILMELYIFLREKTRKEIDGLKQALHLRQKELVVSTQENNELLKRIQELEDNLSIMTQERDLLKQNNIDSFNKVKEFSCLFNEEIKDLMNKNSCKQITFSERAQSMKKIASEIKQISLTYEAFEHTISKLKELQERFDEIQIKYQAKIQKLKEVLRGIRTKNGEMESQSKENESQIISLSNKINEKETVIKELRDKVALFEATLQKFEVFIREAFVQGFATSFKEETIARLALWAKKEPIFKQFSNLFMTICENMDKNSTVFDSQIKKTNQEIAHLQKEIKHLNAEKSQLKQKLEKLQQKELQQLEEYRLKDLALDELRRILARIEEVCLLLSTNIRELYGENPQENLPHYKLKDRVHRMKQIIGSIQQIKELEKVYDFIKLKTGVSDKDLSILEFKAASLQKEKNYIQMYEPTLSQELVVHSTHETISHKTPSRQKKVVLSLEKDDEIDGIIGSVKRLESTKNSSNIRPSVTPKSTKVKTTNFVQTTPTANSSSPKYFKSVGSSRKNNPDPSNIQQHK